MNKLSRETLAEILKRHRLKARLVYSLRYVPENIEDWEDLDMLAVTDRNENVGVLLVELDDLYNMPYTLLTNMSDKLSGRSKPITCDFCYTWQKGGAGAMITFTVAVDRTISFLVCRDLKCSLHVRNRTPEAALPRSQLLEDITTEQRIIRMKSKLKNIITSNGFSPVT